MRYFYVREHSASRPVLVAAFAALIAAATPTTLRADDLIPGYLSQVSSANLVSVATDLVTLYGPRRVDFFRPYVDGNCTLGSTAYPKSNIEMSSDYVSARFQAMGYAPASVTMEAVPGGLGHNVYVTKVGSVYPNVYIEFGAHLDSVQSPGGSDNASGVTAVVELARVLKDYPNRYSMRFVLWVSEEASESGVYVGSAYHIQQALSRGEQIKALLNMDQIGWRASSVSTDYMNEVSYAGAESEAIANLFSQVRTDYGIAIGFRTNQGLLSSDQQVYWDRGLVAVGSEGGFSTYHPNYHGCGDTVSNIDFTNVLRVAQQNLAVSLRLDGGSTSSTLTTTLLNSTPNPSLYNQAVTFTATVTAAVGTPTGTVTFKDGASTIGTSVLNSSGVSTLVTSSLSVGSHSVTAVYSGDGSHDGSTSSPVVQVVSSSGSPAPVAVALSPNSTTAGGDAFVLTVTGTDFAPSSLVRWNGANRTTTYVSATVLTAAVPASDISASGTAFVTVYTPAPGGGTSQALTFTINNPTPASSGVLLAAYSMDEGAGTVLTDSASQSNNGTLVNGTAWTTGHSGKALSFDGVNDYVSMPNAATLELSGKELTIEFWANVQQGGSTPDGVILAKPWTSGQMNSPYYQYGVEFWGGNRSFVFVVGTQSGARFFSLPAAYSTWNHVAFTYDGSYVRGYLNGVQTFAAAESSSLTVRGTTLRLGVDATLHQPFKGMLDDLRIYSRSLSQAEVQADMNTPVGGSPAPVISGFTPSSGPAGTVVTISGSGFAGATAVKFNGTSASSFTVNGDAQITATAPAGATSGPLSVTAPGGTVTSGSAFTVIAAPVISGFTPSSGPAGTVVTISGSGFAGATAVKFNGTSASSFTVNGNTQITATAPAGATTGPLSVTAPGGTVTSGSAFTVVAPGGNPIPVAVALSPNSTTAGGDAFVLTVNGTDFVTSSVVRWKGANRTTTYVSATALTAAIPASDISASGTAFVTVYTSAPGGGTSQPLTFTINNPTPTPSGVLLAAYSMDEGAGTVLTDSTSQSNNGTLVNGTAWTTGHSGKALSFDGTNDYVSMPNAAAFELSGKQLTIEFWANVQQGGSTPDGVILAKPWTSGRMNSPYYQYGVEFWGGNRSFVFVVGTQSGARFFSLPAAYSTWNHVAFTYDGSYVRGYLNGVQKFAAAESSSLTVRGTTLRLGVDATLHQPFKGMLDDLRIYSGCLSQAEVQADMNTPVGGSPAP